MGLFPCAKLNLPCSPGSPKGSVGTGCPGPAMATLSLLFSDSSRHPAVVDMSAVGAVTAGQNQVCLSARESSL